MIRLKVIKDIGLKEITIVDNTCERRALYADVFSTWSECRRKHPTTLTEWVYSHMVTQHTWLRTLEADLQPLNIGINLAWKYTQDREHWKHPRGNRYTLQLGACSWWWWWVYRASTSLQCRMHCRGYEYINISSRYSSAAEMTYQASQL